MQTNHFDNGQIKMEIIDAQNENIKISLLDDKNYCWVDCELTLTTLRELYAFCEKYIYEHKEGKNDTTI